MMAVLRKNLQDAATDPITKVVIITGRDPYYCAGVDLAGLLSFRNLSMLRLLIAVKNQSLFDQFLNFPKPIIIAVNGPAIGASVTSATLCDAIIASKQATFSTPFYRLAVTPEGCSSVHFEYLIGKNNAQRMLGKEGWIPTGDEAAQIGLITKCVDHIELMDEATKLARKWINEEYTGRKHMGFNDTLFLKEVNRRESEALADAFLSKNFLTSQANFLKGKGKHRLAYTFKFLAFTNPIWSKFI